MGGKNEVYIGSEQADARSILGVPIEGLPSGGEALVYNPATGVWEPGSASPSSMVGTEFVYRPGGTASGNVYTSWSTMMTAVATRDGPKVIVIDTSAGAASVPAGTWDLTGVILRGYKPGFTTLTVVEGVTFTKLRSVDGLTIDFSGSTAPISDIVAGGDVFALSYLAKLVVSGSGPMISVPAGALLVLVQDGQVAKNNYEVIDLATSTSTAFLYLGNRAVLEGDSIRGVASSSLSIQLYGSAMSVGLTAGDYTNFAGSFALVRKDAALRIGYDKTASGLTATDVKNAIDELDTNTETVQTNLDNHEADAGNPHSVTAAQSGAIPTTEKAAANGVAPLDGVAQVPAVNLPNVEALSTLGAAGKVPVSEGTTLAMKDLEDIRTDGDANTVPISDGAGAISMALANCLIKGKKGSSGTISAGEVVYPSGWNVGGWHEFELAKADSASTMPAIGIAIESFTNTTFGHVKVIGQLTGLDTQTPDFNVGDDLYVSAATAGALTKTAPTGTNLVQKIAQCLRRNISVGVIEIFGAGRENALPNLPQDKIWVGNGSGVPTETAHIAIGAAGRFTSAGGDAIEDVTLTGVTATSKIFATLNVEGSTPRAIVTAEYQTTDTVRVTFDGDPSTDHEFSVFYI